MCKLSVNVNKIATIRNARGGNNPNLIQVVKDIERFGAEGITVHPRPDERHIRYEDVYQIKEVYTTEFNIEGYPDKRFMDLVLEVRPEQVTLVPDGPDVLTSNAGWDTITHASFLKDIVDELKANGIRTSIFIDTDLKFFEPAKKTGTDRVELYTESYARGFSNGIKDAVEPYLASANLCKELGLGINAGHDLDLENLKYFNQHVKGLLEVSIGHALVCDALYLGLENTINMYKNQLV